MMPQTPIGQLSQQMAQGVPTLDQNTMGSPNFDPSLGAQPQTAMPQGSPATMMHLDRARQRRGMQSPQGPQQQGQGEVTLPIQDQNPQQPGVQVPPTEAELIIKALTSRLGHHNKMEESIKDALIPSPEQASAQL